jgi:hypothetical protein
MSAAHTTGVEKSGEGSEVKMLHDDEKEEMREEEENADVEESVLAREMAQGLNHRRSVPAALDGVADRGGPTTAAAVAEESGEVAHRSATAELSEFHAGDKLVENLTKLESKALHHLQRGELAECNEYFDSALGKACLWCVCMPP